MHNKNIIRIVLATIFILLIPLLAMQITNEVVWDLADFIVAGILLLSAGLSYEFFASDKSNTTHRIAIGIVITVVLILIWMELAVGLFGTPWAGS